MAVRLMLIGAPGTELRLAAEMARDAGAEVTMADTPDAGLSQLRASASSLVFIDVEADVARFMGQIRAERFTIPVLACGIEASASRAVAAIRAGARDYVPLPPERALIAAAIRSAADEPPAHIIGEDGALVRAAAFGLAMAQARVPILISGEKGSGKEVMARAIHQHSGRSGRFLTTECAGVAAEILESELFGHEAGAFPGAAARRLGQLEKAADGTLLLRDIEALPAPVQARLQTALQTGMVRRIGGDEPQPITARLIVSTSADLQHMATLGQFRADLIARLALVQVQIPALRQRPDDIPLLARHLLAQLARTDDVAARSIDDEALALLLKYDWPGNVGELEHVLHRAMLLAEGPAIGADDIVLIDGVRLSARLAPTTDKGCEVTDLVGHTVEEVERELILRTLERCRGNRTYASTILGISVRTMRNKLKSFVESGIAVAPAC
jgi:DNA-binding NtrC family response regulator